MLRPDISVRSDSIMPTTANFVVAYTPSEPATMPADEDVAMMCAPSPCASMRGRKVRTPLNTPLMFTSMAQSQSCHDTLLSSAGMPTPALFTSR